MSGIFGDIFQRKRALMLYVPLLLLYTCSYFQRTAIPGMIFDELKIDGLSAFQISALSASFVWVYSLTQLPVGVLVDRHGGRRIVMAGGALFCIGVLLFPLCRVPWQMNLLRMLTGLGAGTMFISLVGEVQRLFGRENYAVVIGIQYFIGYGGGLLGTLPFERLISVCPWRNALFGIALFSLLIYLWFLSGGYGEKGVPPPPGKAEKPPLFRTLWQIVRNRFLWAVIYCATINFATYYTIQTVIGKKMLCDVAGMSSAGAASVIFSLTFVCMFVLFFSSLITRMLNNRRKPLMYFACFTSFLMVLWLAAAIFWKLPSWCFAVGFIMLAASSGCCTIFGMTAQELGTPTTVSQSAALNNMVNYFAVVLFSLMIGIILDCFAPAGASGAVCYPHQAYFTIFGILAFLAFIGLVICFLIPETQGRFAAEREKRICKSGNIPG